MFAVPDRGAPPQQPTFTSTISDRVLALISQMEMLRPAPVHPLGHILYHVLLDSYLQNKNLSALASHIDSA
jgi:hypothetical protein